MALIVEKDYSEFEIAECKRLYDVIVRRHVDCDGTGMRMSDDGIIDCECEAVYKYAKQLIYSRIPRRFWGVDYNSWMKMLNRDIHSVFERMTNQGINSSCTIFGSDGSGKTSLLSILGKIGIWNGQNVFYLTSEDLIEFRRKDSENKIYLDRLSGSDVVLFDNLTRYHKSEWATGQIEFCLRNLFDAGIQVIVSSSQTMSELDQMLSSGLIAFIEKLGNPIVVQYRGQGELKTNLMSEPLLKEAVKYFQTQLSITATA